MKRRLFSFLGIGAIVLATACNSTEDASTADVDTLGTTGTTMNTDMNSAAGVQTSADGRRYVLRPRTTDGTTATGTSGTTTTTQGTNRSSYDTVWLYMGTDSRFYTMGGAQGRDTLYFNTEQWNSWWSNPNTDNEFKYKSGDTKIKVDDDGSWKVKDSEQKTKMDEDGKVKTKPRN